MTSLKLGMMGAVLATGLVGGAGQAKADEARFDVGPAHVDVFRSALPWRRWHRSVIRPVVVRPGLVVAPPPARVVGYGYGTTTGYGYGYDQTAYQVAQIRSDMERASDDLRFDVRNGSVDPQALASLEADRQEIERDLTEASAKGYLTAEDQEHLEAHVQEIRELRSQFPCRDGAQTVGYYR